MWCGVCANKRLYLRLVPLSWFFLNGLLFDEQVDHVVKELDVEEALKSPIFVKEKAAAPKIGVEFCQGTNGTIRNSLTTSYDVARRHSIFFDKRNETNEHTKPHVGAAPHHNKSEYNIVGHPVGKYYSE